MPLERNLYNLAIRQIKDQVTAPADLDGLYQLVPLLISVDGGWITALLQHLLKGRFTELFVAVYVVCMITRYTKELPTESFLYTINQGVDQRKYLK